MRVETPFSRPNILTCYLSIREKLRERQNRGKQKKKCWNGSFCSSTACKLLKAAAAVLPAATSSPLQSVCIFARWKKRSTHFELSCKIVLSFSAKTRTVCCAQGFAFCTYNINPAVYVVADSLNRKRKKNLRPN